MFPDNVESIEKWVLLPNTVNKAKEFLEELKINASPPFIFSLFYCF